MSECVVVQRKVAIVGSQYNYWLPDVEARVEKDCPWYIWLLSMFKPSKRIAASEEQCIIGGKTLICLHNDPNNTIWAAMYWAEEIGGKLYRLRENTSFSW